jgi:prevent-host-death family protein
MPNPGRKKSAGHARVAEPVALYDAKTRLSELVDLAAAGREFVIGKSGKPLARLVPYVSDDARKLRVPGKGKGEMRMADDFDAPLPAEVLALFGGAGA